jgi:hypothetical protein
MTHHGKHLIVLALMAAPVIAAGSVFHVSPAGSDRDPGSSGKPFQTVGKAASILQPGDTCLVHSGNYHENIVLDNMKGTEAKPAVFKVLPGEKVVLDGTEPVPGPWARHKGNIYKTKVRKDTWQLFVDGTEMLSARWPNASLDPGADNYLWAGRDSGAWARQDGESKFGQLHDDALAELDLDLTGAIAILNVGRFVTFSRFVRNHAKGKGQFDYTREFTQPALRHSKRSSIPKIINDHSSVWKWKKVIEQGRYFVEGKLELLDSPTEWFYDRTTGMLYLWCSDGRSPEGRDVRGKTLTYAVEVRGSSNVTFEGFDFFASTFRFNNARDCRVENCNFRNFATNRRMIGLEVEDTRMWAEEFCATDLYANGSIIRNCTFRDCEGAAFRLLGSGNVAENVLMANIDWSGIGCVSVRTYNNNTLRRLEANRTGGSECLRVAAGCLVELCRIGPTVGIMQEDGATIQVHPHMDTVVRQNWSFGHRKFGIRPDGPGMQNVEARMRRARVYRNVVWGLDTTHNKEGIKLKGDEHVVAHNSSFDNVNVDIGVPAKVQEYRHNTRTVTRNNAAGEISGHRNPAVTNVPPGGTVDHNFVGDIASQLNDAANYDFRPRADSPLIDAGVEIEGITREYIGKAPDIGAYESGESNYWIPGFQRAQASHPIPADGATDVGPSIDLMWLKGWGTEESDLYLGTDRSRVEKATIKSPEYMGRQKNNIYRPKQLKSGTTYYWRVDAVDETGAVKGAVWSLQCR